MARRTRGDAGGGAQQLARRVAEPMGEMMKQIDSPSNRLYRGEITNFREAMRAVQGECTFEMSFSSGDKELDEKMDSGLREFSNQAKQALAIYLAQVSAAENCAIGLMRAAGLNDFADALESGDYSGLAI